MTGRLSFSVLAVSVVLVACGGDKEDAEDDTGGSGADDTPELLYPSGDRILMYTGHGGWEEDSTDKAGVDDVDARWKGAFGWNTDVNSSLPDDLTPYRTIFLLGPGSNSSSAFDETTNRAFKQALGRGTRVVLTGESSMCGSAEVADFLGILGSTITFTGESTDANRLVDVENLSSGMQLTEGVSELRFKEPCFVDPGSGTSIGRDSSRDHVGAVELPATGGEIVVLGDFEFLDDGGLLEFGDNGVFSDNLVLVESSGK